MATLDVDNMSADQLWELAAAVQKRLRAMKQGRGGDAQLLAAIGDLNKVMAGRADAVLTTLREIAQNTTTGGGAAADPYDEIMNRLQLCQDTFTSWRERFERHSQRLGQDIAKAFNKYRTMGNLQGPEIDPADIQSALEQPHQHFERESLDRFTGPALGDLWIYRPGSGSTPTQEVEAPKSYSIWGPAQHRNDKYIQRITGSNKEFVNPDDLPAILAHLARTELDLTFNAYTEGLGLVSWVSFFQNHNNQMRSIGYELGGKLLWVNQLLDPDMKPTVGPLSVGGLTGDPVIITENQLVLSIDWPDVRGGKKYFNVYAMHINFDFERGRAQFAGPILKLTNEVTEL